MMFFTPTTLALGAAMLAILWASRRKGSPPPGLARSESKIATLDPAMRPLVRALIERAWRQYKIPLIVTSGYRSADAQAALYAQGRDGDTRPIVTNARPGRSWHNHRRAADVAVLNAQGAPTWPTDDMLWQRVGAAGEFLELNWGGRWDKPDREHFSFHPHISMNQAEQLWLIDNPQHA